MTRSCCIKKCSSRYRYQTYQRKGKEKERVLFKFPLNNEERSVELLANIGDNFNEEKSTCKNIFICDLHFDASCFHEGDNILQKNGETVSIKRQRPRLKKNAVPTLFNVQLESSKIPKEVNRSKHISQRKHEQVSGCTIPSDLANSPSKNSENVLSPKSKSKQKSLRRKPQTAPNTVSSKRTAGGTLVFSVESNVIIKSEHENSTENYEKFALKEENPDEYSKASLLHDWKSLTMEQLPDHWALLEATVGTLFVYTGDDLNRIRITRSILVKNDMLIEIQVEDCPARCPNIHKINKLEDLLTAMALVPFLQICPGSGDNPCPDVLYCRVPKSKSIRCKICQLKFRRKQDREKKKEQRAQTTHDRTTSLVQNLKQKYKRAKKKIEKQKKIIEEMRAKCAYIKEEPLDEIMND